MLLDISFTLHNECILQSTISIFVCVMKNPYRTNLSRQVVICLQWWNIIGFSNVFLIIRHWKESFIWIKCNYQRKEIQNKQKICVLIYNKKNIQISEIKCNTTITLYIIREWDCYYGIEEALLLKLITNV